MGTNYYFHENPCSACGVAKKVLHIGKSSFGWTFTFRGYRNHWEFPPLESWAQWLAYLKEAKGEIRDEDDEPMHLDQLIEMVQRKANAPNNHTLACRVSHPEHAKECWLDAEGHSFTGTEFS